MAPLRAEDYLVMSYRTRGHALARGTPPEAVMAELFGRSGGCARGRGGSVHLLDVERNLLGGWGIVCGQVPIATGVALALVRQGRRQAVLCELGDGAVGTGLPGVEALDSIGLRREQAIGRLRALLYREVRRRAAPLSHPSGGYLDDLAV